MHQPVATDLRRISSVLKIANELERVADLAVHIAERACGLVTWPEVYAPANLKEMAGIAGEMLRNSIDAYVEMDSGLARRVCSRDETVDRLNREIIEEILRRMKETPAYIEPLLHLFSKCIELTIITTTVIFTTMLMIFLSIFFIEAAGEFCSVAATQRPKHQTAAAQNRRVATSPGLRADADHRPSSPATRWCGSPAAHRRSVA